MEIKEAEHIYSSIKSSQLKELVSQLVNSGIRYSRIRVDWFFLSPKERMEMDSERTIAHNAFISSCDILVRNMKNIGKDNSWRNKLGNNRKIIGDFACIIHKLVGIKAR